MQIEKAGKLNIGYMSIEQIESYKRFKGCHIILTNIKRGSGSRVLGGEVYHYGKRRSIALDALEKATKEKKPSVYMTYVSDGLQESEGIMIL